MGTICATCRFVSTRLWGRFPSRTLIPASALYNLWCSVIEQFPIRWLSASHLSKWAWRKRYSWHLKVCFLPWSSHWNRQRMMIKIKLYDKRDDFTLPIVNPPFISSNIPASPAHGCYISQLIRYSRVCAQYNDFLDRAQLLTQKLLE
jgi:hypothetical protein